MRKGLLLLLSLLLCGCALMKKSEVVVEESSEESSVVEESVEEVVYALSLDTTLHYAKSGSSRTAQLVANIDPDHPDQIEATLTTSDGTVYPILFDATNKSVVDNEEGSDTFGKEMNFNGNLSLQIKNRLICFYYEYKEGFDASGRNTEALRQYLLGSQTYAAELTVLPSCVWIDGMIKELDDLDTIERTLFVLSQNESNLNRAHCAIRNLLAIAAVTDSYSGKSTEYINAAGERVYINQKYPGNISTSLVLFEDIDAAMKELYPNYYVKNSDYEMNFEKVVDEATNGYLFEDVSSAGIQYANGYIHVVSKEEKEGSVELKFQIAQMTIEEGEYVISGKKYAGNDKFDPEKLFSSSDCPVYKVILKDNGGRLAEIVSFEKQ